MEETLSHRSSVPFLHLRLENKDKKVERSREQSGNGGTPGVTRIREDSLSGCANVSRETAITASPAASSRGRARGLPRFDFKDTMANTVRKRFGVNFVASLSDALGHRG
jgi:hypothetical protein